MIKRLTTALLLTFIILGSQDAKAKSEFQTKNERIEAERAEKIQKYSLPRTGHKPVSRALYDDSQSDDVAFPTYSQRRISLGNSSYSGVSSPGLTVRTTYDDWQYTYKGHRIDSWPGRPAIHFTYGDRNDLSVLQGYGYNIYDPTNGGSWPHGLNGGCRVQADSVNGDYPNLAVYPNGKVVLAGSSGLDSLPEHLLVSNDSEGGCFWGTGSSIPDTQYISGFIDTVLGSQNLRHPIVATQIIGADTITHVIAGEAMFTVISGTSTIYVAPIQYFRRIGTDQLSPTIAWSGPVTLDTASARGHLAVSPISPKIAVTYFLPTASGITNDWSNDQDVFYRESFDGGLSWQPKINITNYDRSQPSYAPWIEKYAIYDSEDFLHIIWNANPWVDPCDSLGFCFIDFSASLFHWTDRTGLISRVANRDYGLVWNTVVCGFGGANALYLAFFNISECDGRLYVTYAGWNDVFGDGTIDDCSSSSGSAGHRAYQANGEIYLQASLSLDGLLWDDPRNITNTYTPGCDSAGFGGVCMNDTKVSMAPMGYDSASFGQELTFPGSELVTISGATVSSLGKYLNIFYLEDHFPGNAQIGRGDFTSNDLKWARVPCVDPVIDIKFSYVPTQIYEIDIVEPNRVDTIPFTITNTGNATLDGELSIVYTSPIAGWLSATGNTFSISPGISNVWITNILIDHNAMDIDPGTIVMFTANLVLLTNDDPPMDSVIIPVEFRKVDPIWNVVVDTVSTTATRLVVRSDGEMGGNGDGGVNLDFSAIGGDCDPSKDVYLYSGGPFIIQADPTDTNISYAMHSIGSGESHEFIPDIGPTLPSSTAGINYEHFSTGTFVNWDTTIALEKSYFAPTGGGDSSEFIIQCLKVYSADGNPHNNLAIGELIDWDIPADDGSNNNAFPLSIANTVYFAGTDTVNSNNCVENPNRMAAQGMLGWYTSSDYIADNCANNKSYFGMYAARNFDLFEIDTSLVANFLWNKISTVNRLTGLEENTDIHQVMTFRQGFNLSAEDTLTFYTVLTAVQNGTPDTLIHNLKTACAWYSENLRNGCDLCGCCFGIAGNVDDDPQEIIDIGDLTALINYLFIPPNDPPACFGEANVDGDLAGDVDIGDLTALIGYLFIPPNVPPAGCQ